MRHFLCIGGLKHRAYRFLYMALSLTSLQLHSVTQLNVNYLSKMFFKRPPGPICFNVPGQ